MLQNSRKLYDEEKIYTSVLFWDVEKESIFPVRVKNKLKTVELHFFMRKNCIFVVKSMITI
ncbi:hypothetical protein C0T31_11155 [Dysgonamonadaceae bacterium]|nr:hypothetical protein C0T31_11155 [Dysgonamonadaceae bacterium]